MNHIIKPYIIWVVLFLFIDITSCNNQNSEQSKHKVSNAVVDVIRLEGGDWGYPTPYAHYPRGPGGFKMCFIFDSLIERDEKGFIPWLAERWDILNNGKQYQFTIRDGVQWHDGKPLTPKDVQFSLEYANHHAMSWSHIYGKIQAVHVSSDRNVLVTVIEPDVSMLDNLGRTRIFPEHIWKTIDNPKLFQTTDAVIGTGPYCLTHYSKSHGTYRFKAFDKFWGPTPMINNLEFVPVSQAILAFEQGDIDVAGIPPDALPRFQNNPEYRIIVGPAFWGYRMLFNLKQCPVFNLKKMRQAICYAIDSNTLIKTTARGAGKPGSPGILSPDHVMFNPSIKPYPYDLDKSRALLDACGYTTMNAENTRMNAKGQTLSFEFLCSSGARMTRSPISEIRIAELIKEFLSRVGIQIKVISMDEKRRDSAIINHSYQLIMVGHGGWGQDPQFLKRRFTESEATNRSLVDYPSYGYVHEELTRLLSLQQLEFNYEKRIRLIWKIQELLADELPEIALFYTIQYTVFRPSQYNGWRMMFDHHSFVHSKLSFLKRETLKK